MPVRELPSGRHNEALDCRVYAWALLRFAGMDLDACTGDKPMPVASRTVRRKGGECCRRGCEALLLPGRKACSSL